jgi:simple sugar transport system substrate-binding protein
LVQEYVRLLEQAMADNPDGIAVPIIDAAAVVGPLHHS